MSRKDKKIIHSTILILVSLALCGSAFKIPEVVMDPQKHIVYQTVKADKLIMSYNYGNAQSARNQYERNYYAVFGRIDEISKNNKKLYLSGLDITDNQKIICEITKKDVKAYIDTFKSDNYVKVYGRVISDIFTNQVKIQTDKIERVDINTVSESEYSLINNISVNREYMIEKKVNKGKDKDKGTISYYITPDWTNVESDIIDSGNGSINGFQYRLNELNKSVYPESFFVCYFDNEEYVDLNDRDSTALIEKAIIANILKEDPAKLRKKFPLKTIDSYYGTRYTYYRDKYTDILNDGYNVEFAFQQDGKKGIIVYLYVYKNPDHIDSVMLTMRMLTVN